MKKSELRQLIKEEIKNIMNTKDDGASGYGEVMRKLTDKMTGGRIPDLTIKNTYKVKSKKDIKETPGEFPATTAKRELEKLRPEIEAIVNNTELVTKDEKEKAYNKLLDREGYSEEVKQYMRRAISGALFRQNLNK
jgi:hypothetical protein